jgi:hypothetical protein
LTNNPCPMACLSQIPGVRSPPSILSDCINPSQLSSMSLRAISASFPVDKSPLSPLEVNLNNRSAADSARRKAGGSGGGVTSGGSSSGGGGGGGGVVNQTGAQWPADAAWARFRWAPKISPWHNAQSSVVIRSHAEDDFLIVMHNGASVLFHYWLYVRMGLRVAVRQ